MSLSIIALSDRVPHRPPTGAGRATPHATIHPFSQVALSLHKLTLAIPSRDSATTESRERLQKHLDRSATAHTHTEQGDTMIYCSATLLLVALAIAAVHLREHKTDPSRPLTLLVAVLALVVAAGSIDQVYRIGESGSRAAWSDAVSPTGSAP
ncbi:hypothetical protein [Rhodococcus koreensis]|uniref:hypothetical protein n=1 Tax=Rhodococcus koreensis TaxID=99653 RepID=UPI00197F3278|nr:hypothetical protein [Rhodococcus koreensis]QSE84734.1 hypothetical protein JWS14_39320 [Rhodococcus koreensis]